MTTNIWSILQKSESITEVYVPPDLPLEVTLDDFYQVLKKQLQEKGVTNTTVNVEDVIWDDGKHSQKRIVARYSGSDAPQNIQQILIGLDDMGSFRYIEEKTFLSRPDLPKFPKNEVAVPTSSGKVAPGLTLPIVGVVIGVISLLLFGSSFIAGLIGLLIAAGLIGLYVKSRSQYTAAEDDFKSRRAAAEKNNSEAEAETRAWNKAWDTWNSDVLETAYLQATTNAFGRFQRSVSSCVRLTITELFEDKKAQLRDTKAKEFTEQQIEEQLQKKRDSFK